MNAVKRDWVLGKGGGSVEEALFIFALRDDVGPGESVRTARRSSSKSAALSTVLIRVLFGLGNTGEGEFL